MQIQIKLHPHRLDEGTSFNYDIGLIQLDRAVIFGADLSPICLTDLFQAEMEPHPSKDVFISGFGLTLYR